ncbi:TetR/AcrR family transcriptional regulator [Actinocorallia sp. API 0066]|uniref:TetR/AcrR family transcriptional regulator n=1 Tax=Actinocorallia sp. API 0066 TaxID=2896846 RepID=UPI001E2F340B|nr:TetR/AcrR family transcriptional regulator [Actinocorallia sp. API 0066]MCD0450082.1 TetR/AcrR family transcriptional regulator [Actinocorallia sp. API 0066]
MPSRPPVQDLARSVYLLWGHHPAPGRSGLSVPRIVAAGLELADAEGLDAVSMRRVADQLGVGAMSLYRHVPGKDDLTALMVDAVHAEAYGDDVEAATRQGDWKDAVRYVAARNWDLYQRHPWLLDVHAARPNLGPHTSRKYETELRALDGGGLSDIEMEAALTLVLNHVAASARAHRAQTRTVSDSGMTDAEWWAAITPALTQVMTDPDLTVSARVGNTVGATFNTATSPTHTYTWGLETLLSGLTPHLTP